MDIENDELDRSWIGMTPLAACLSAHTAQRIEQQARRHNYKKGHEILARSDETTDVFVLIEGTARAIVYSPAGKTISFRRLIPGDLFGELSAIDGQSPHAVIEAAEPCRALSINRTLFHELIESDTGFAKFVCVHLATQARSLINRIVEFSTLPVTSRVHMELLRLAQKSVRAHGPHEISPAPTHTEIAGWISTHREAVSREISRLKGLGILESRGRALIIKDMESLKAMARTASGEQDG